MIACGRSIAVPALCQGLYVLRRLTGNAGLLLDEKEIFLWDADILTLPPAFSLPLPSLPPNRFPCQSLKG